MHKPNTQHISANVAMALAEDLAPESIVCNTKDVTIEHSGLAANDITAALYL